MTHIPHLPTPGRPRSVRAAWAGRPPEPGSEPTRLIAAAAACIGRDGVAATGVASVAAEAGVSRPTVYRYFEDRDALINATLMEAARSYSQRHADHIAQYAEAGDQAVESLLFSLASLPHDPVLGAVFREREQFDVLAIRQFTSPVSVRHALVGLEPVRRAAGWSEQEALECVEVMMRTLVSLLVSPSPDRDPAELRAFLQRRLLPAIGLERGSGLRQVASAGS